MPPSRWNPSGNAVHRLVQLLDVLAIALNRFRAHSYNLPRPDAPDYTPEKWQAHLGRLMADHFSVKRKVFPTEDQWPQVTAARLTSDAVAEALRAGYPDGTEAAVRRAGVYLPALGMLFGPTYYPHNPSSESNAIFEAEGRIIQEYLAAREQVMSAVCRDGPFPPEVHRRVNQMVVYAGHPAEKDLTHDGLLAMVDAAHSVPENPPTSAEDERLNREFVDRLDADARRKAELYARPGGDYLRLADDLRRDVVSSHTIEDVGLSVDMAGVAKGVRAYWTRARMIGEPPGRDLPDEPARIETKADERNALTKLWRWADRCARDAGLVPGGEGRTTVKGRPSTRTNVNARLLALLQADPSAYGWSAAEIAAHLGCSPGTVKGTLAWEQSVMAGRAIRQAQAAARMDTSRTAAQRRRR